MRLREVIQKTLLRESFKDARRIFLDQYDDEQLIDRVLESFKENKDRLDPPLNDISYWIKAGFPALYHRVQQLEAVPSKREHKKEIERAKREAEVILDNELATAVIPLSRKAACYYGKHGDWCISTENEEENYFNKYVVHDGKIFIMVNVHDEDVVDSLRLFTLEIDTENIKLWDKDNNDKYHCIYDDEDDDECHELNDVLIELTGEGIEFYTEAVEDYLHDYNQIVDNIDEEKDEQQYKELLDDPDINTLTSYILEHDILYTEMLDHFDLIALSWYQSGDFDEIDIGRYVGATDYDVDGRDEKVENYVIKKIVTELCNKPTRSDECINDLPDRLADFIGGIENEHKLHDTDKQRIISKVLNLLEQGIRQKIRKNQEVDAHVNIYKQVASEFGLNPSLSKDIQSVISHQDRYGREISKHNQKLFMEKKSVF